MANLSETELRVAFDYFDKDGNGSLTDEVLGDVLRLAGMNPTDAEIDKLFKEADRDNNGKIEFSEFAKLMKEVEAIDCREELRSAFNHFDINGDGRISAEELQTRLEYSIEDAREIVKEADLDEDGLIDFEEFIKVLSGQGNVFDSK